MQRTTVLATHEWPPPTQTDTGAAAPLAVLVHGITGWWRTWWRVGPALANSGFRVIGIDLPGHGDSSAIDGVATVRSMADDIAANLDGIGVDVLVGHSLGGAVCMNLAFSRPDIARRLVVEDPPGLDRSDDDGYQKHLRQEVAYARAAPEADVKRRLAEHPSWLEEDARQRTEGCARCDLEGILASVRADTRRQVVELVPEIPIPTLYLLADAQRSVLGPRRSELVASMPSHSIAVEFDSGHTIHRDRFDEYMAALLGWLDG